MCKSSYGNKQVVLRKYPLKYRKSSKLNLCDTNRLSYQYLNLITSIQTQTRLSYQYLNLITSRFSCLQFYVYVLQIVVCPFVLFLWAIVLSVLRFTDSDYPFGIFKLLIFFHLIMIILRLLNRNALIYNYGLHENIHNMI